MEYPKQKHNQFVGVWRDLALQWTPTFVANLDATEALTENRDVWTGMTFHWTTMGHHIGVDDSQCTFISTFSWVPF